MRRPPRTATARTAQQVRDEVRERRRFPRTRGATLPENAGGGGGCCYAVLLATDADPGPVEA